MTYNKLIINITFLSFLSSCSSIDSKNNSLDEYGLNGNVKSTIEQSYKANEKFGKVVKGEKKLEFSWRQNQYNIYDDYGYLIERNNIDDVGELVTKSIFNYNKNFELLEINHYNSNGTLSDKSNWKYDNKGNNIENINYNSSGIYLNKMKRNFNDNNLVVEEMFIDSLNNIISKSIYEYDSKNNRVKEIYYYNGKFNNKNLSKYNDKNQEISFTILDSANNIIEKRTQKYNDNSLLIETKKININGEIIREEKLKYDEQNNWIEKIIYDGQKPTFLIFRKIEYFK
jgi:hypothetical protein